MNAFLILPGLLDVRKNCLKTAFFHCFYYVFWKGEDCAACHDSELLNFAVAAGPVNGFELPPDGGVFKPGIFEIFLV